MVSRSPRSRGFSLVETFVILGVVVLMSGLGFVGWKALKPANQTMKATPASTTKSVEVITTKDDLEAAEKALDELNFEDTSAFEAETQATL